MGPPHERPLYMDPYPLNEATFLVAHNPDQPWDDPRAYGLYLIDEAGNHELIYDDAEYSCWQPTPLRPRRRPPILRLGYKRAGSCTPTTTSWPASLSP